ncbi:MAG: ion transporter [Bacteroidetes bacterium]|nr:ion transporter [Bacteroidota bacterium]
MLGRFFLSERNIMIAIVVNAIIIFLLYFKEYSNETFLQSIDYFFILFFLIEAIVKISIWGYKTYFKKFWNRFDFIIVAISLPTLLEPFFLESTNTSLVLLLRLFRLVRLIRFIRFIPHMSSILAGIVRALKASVFVILALVFFNFLLALFTCHFYQDIVPEYFGDPLTSSYSIFQLFTLEGWNEIPKAIEEAIADNGYHPMLAGVTRFYFVIIVLIGGIFGMSLANAIFVDEMTMDNTKEMEEKIDKLQEQVAELKELLQKK